jgi:hypothetical protein
MREKFVDHRFSAASLKAIKTINDILAEYARQGYRLSLRQLYYQLVARGLIENSVRSYKRTGNLVSDARLAGLVDWDMIEDRGRETVVNSHWNSPAEIIRTAAKAFRVDRWEGQPCYVEVFVEKDALSGILEPVCRGLDIRFTANRGYSSSSAMYEAGKRIAGAVEAGLEVHLFYLGDHDPSGIDMTRDITERLNLFTWGSVTRRTVQRLALNYDQVEQWQPPENPAKETDSRYQVYVDQFGESSWELDAVEPATLAGLVNQAVQNLIDRDTWDEVEKRETAMRKELERYADEHAKRAAPENKEG